MSRKARPWVVIAAALYLLVLWSAFHWGKSQRLPDGSIFDHLENERRRKLALEKQPEIPPPPTAESRLNAGIPAFIAVRYDATHAVFMVANETESRFAEPAAGRSSATLRKISAPEKPAAELAGMQELWEPESFAHLPELVKEMSSDEDKQWTLQLSPESTVPVTLDRPVIAPNGCSLQAGFLVAIPPSQQPLFAATSQEYFVIRRAPAQLSDPIRSSRHISELRAWQSTPDFHKQLAALLSGRMKQELSRIDATLVANAQNPNQPEPTWPTTHVRTRPTEWIRIDGRLARDEGKLDHDVRAFRLTPDGVPRLFVRARWKLDDAPVFLMTAWFRESLQAEGSHTEARPVLLSADSSWSAKLREGEAPDDLGSNLDFQTVLSEFDADHDGWAEVLVRTIVPSNGGPSADITLYLYTDLGLAPLKASFRRDLASPESCLQQQ
ncbi:MAG: hypothetical protein LAO24_12175 [Acidobacteriia bacterium]|nr:hypothetical protein [Terriglobia bacterium]